jgi:hypothetical protein
LQNREDKENLLRGIISFFSPNIMEWVRRFIDGLYDRQEKGGGGDAFKMRANKRIIWCVTAD